MLRCSTMEQIGVRELRQQASRYLRRVEAGESFLVTDYGRPVAVLASTIEAVRAESDAVLDRLVEAGVYPSVDAAVAADVDELSRAVVRAVGRRRDRRRLPARPPDRRRSRGAHAAGVRAIAAEPW